MNIVLMAQHYAPEEVSGAVLATQLSVDLAKRNHRVTFVTCAPNYPKGIVFPGYKNRFVKEEINGVQIRRVWSYISRSKQLWARILNFGTFGIMAYFGGMMVGKPDLVVSYSPPLPLGLSAWLLSSMWGVPWVLRVEDLYPETAINAGVIKNKVTIRILEWFERMLYDRADHVSLISDGFRQKLIARGVHPGKLSVEPVWADSDEVMPMPRQTAFRQEYGLSEKFVVMYTGNMGMVSDLDDVISVAAALRGNEKICFVLIGEGARKKEYEDRASDAGLRNIMFLPYQPRARYSEVLASADCVLVSLNMNSATTSLPSKTFSYLASGRPLVVLAPQECELARLVVDTGCGLVVNPGHVEELVKAIYTIADHPMRSELMGEKGRVLLIEHYSREHCVSLYEQLFLKTVA